MEQDDRSYEQCVADIRRFEREDAIDTKCYQYDLALRLLNLADKLIVRRLSNKDIAEPETPPPDTDSEADAISISDDDDNSSVF